MKIIKGCDCVCLCVYEYMHAWQVRHDDVTRS